MAITTTTDRVVFSQFERARSDDMNKLQAAMGRSLNESVGRMNGQRTIMDVEFASPGAGEIQSISYPQVIVSGLDFVLPAISLNTQTVTVTPGSALIKLDPPLGEMNGDYALVTQREPIDITIDPGIFPGPGIWLARLTVPVVSVTTVTDTRDIFDPLTGNFTSVPFTPVESGVVFDWPNLSWTFIDATTGIDPATYAGASVPAPVPGTDSLIIGQLGWVDTFGIQGFWSTAISDYTPRIDNLNASSLTAPKHTFTCSSDGGVGWSGTAWTPYRGVFELQPGGGSFPGTNFADDLVTGSGYAVVPNTRYEIWGFAGTDETYVPTARSGGAFGIVTHPGATQRMGGSGLVFSPVFARNPTDTSLEVNGVNAEVLDAGGTVGGPFPIGSCVYLGAVYQYDPGVPPNDPVWLAYSESNGEGTVQSQFPHPTFLTATAIGAGGPLVGWASEFDPAGPNVFESWDLVNAGIPGPGIVPGKLVRSDSATFPNLNGDLLAETIGPQLSFSGVLDEIKWSMSLETAFSDTLDFVGFQSQNQCIFIAGRTTVLNPYAAADPPDTVWYTKGVPYAKSWEFSTTNWVAGENLYALFYDDVAIAWNSFDMFTDIPIRIAGWVRSYRQIG